MQSEARPRSTLEAAAADMFAKLNRSGALDRLRKAVEAKMTGDDRRMEQIQRRTEELLKEEKGKELHKLDTRMLLAQTKRNVLTAELEEDVRMDVANAMKELMLREMFNEEVAGLKNVGQSSKIVSESANQQSVGGRALLANLFKYPMSKGKENKGVERKVKEAKTEKSHVVGNVRGVQKAVGGGEEGKYDRDSASGVEVPSTKYHEARAQGKGFSAAVAGLVSISAKGMARDGGKLSVTGADAARDEARTEQVASAPVASKSTLFSEADVENERKDSELSCADTKTLAQEERATRTGSGTSGDLTHDGSADANKVTAPVERPVAPCVTPTLHETRARIDKKLEESLTVNLTQKIATAEEDMRADRVGAVLGSAQEGKAETPSQSFDKKRMIDQRNQDQQAQQGNRSFQVTCDSSFVELQGTVNSDAVAEETMASSPEKRAAEEKELERSGKKSVELPALTSTEEPGPTEVDVQKAVILKAVDGTSSRSIIDTTPKREFLRPFMLRKNEEKHGIDVDGNVVPIRCNDKGSKIESTFDKDKSEKLIAGESNAVERVSDVTSKGRLMSPERSSCFYENESNKGVKALNDVNECLSSVNGPNAVEDPGAATKDVREERKTHGCKFSRVSLVSKSVSTDSEQPLTRKSPAQSAGAESGKKDLKRGLGELKVASGRVRKQSSRKKYDSDTEKANLRKVVDSARPVCVSSYLRPEKGELMTKENQEMGMMKVERSDAKVGEKKPGRDDTPAARKSTKRRRDEHKDSTADVLKEANTYISSPTRKRPRTSLREDMCAPHDYDEQQKILNVLLKLAEAPHAYPFLDPVDPNDEGCENYYRVITNPMNVYKITERLKISTPKAGYYASVDNVMQDIELIWSNCRKFNGDYDSVVKDAERCINTLDILLEQEGLRKAASGRAKRRRSRVKLRNCQEDDKAQPEEKSREIRAKVATLRQNRVREEEEIGLKRAIGVNDGRLVGKFLFVFTKVGSKKAWVEIKVISFEKDSGTYTVQWKETGKMTNEADFGPESLYPVYRIGRQE